MRKKVKTLRFKLEIVTLYLISLTFYLKYFIFYIFNQWKLVSINYLC